METSMQLRKLASTSSRTKMRCAKAGNRSTANSASVRYKKRKKGHNRCRRNDKCVCRSMDTFGAFEFPKIWMELRLKAQLCDGIVYCNADHEVFKIHRAILSAASPYFRVLFTNSINRGEAETYEANVNTTGTVFALVLDYAYTGSCAVNAANVESLLQCADQYDVLGVMQLCCKFLWEELTCANCLGVLKFASQYFCKDLIRRGQKYVKHHFSKILADSCEFVTIDRAELRDILSDDELNVKTEEVVFDAIVKWIGEDVEGRKKYLLELLRCVRFGSLPRECVCNLQLHPLVKNDRECLDYMSRILVDCDTVACTGNANINNPLFRPRISFDVLFAIGGWSAGSPTNFVETYDVRADKWLLSSDTDSVPRAYHGICTMNGLIYIIGGFDGNQYFNTVKRFDPVSRTWDECACMYFCRCYVSVVMTGNRIYAMGGYNGRLRMNTAERYDPDKNQWELIPPMQKQRSDASAAAINEKIYIVGGFNGQEVMRSAEMFDVKANQWTFIPQMISARSGVSLVVYGNALYALGGFNGYVRLTSVERYLPGNATWWTEVTDMMTPRSNFATVVLDDFIYVIGGFNGSSTINFVEYYDPQADEWYDASPMNLNRSALSACVISGLPNSQEYSILGRNHEERGQGAEHNNAC